MKRQTHPMKYGSGKLLHVFSEDCFMNQAAGEVFRAFLASRGWACAPSAREADLVIHLTCANHQNCERLTLAHLRQLRQQLKPGARLVVSGCLPKINPRRLAREFQGTVIDSRSFSGAAQALLGPEAPAGACLEDRARRSFHHETPESFTIVTATGCRHRCSFCGVKKAAGPLRSRPVEAILREAQAASRRGQSRIRLVADDNGSYGLDIGTDLARLLEELLRIPGDFSIDIWQLNPWGLIRLLPRLLPSIASGRVASLRSQFQSGNDQVLSWMNRPYRIADFETAIRRLRRADGRLRLRTSVIVGFPGESEAAFQDTLRVILDGHFEDVAVFGFSARPGNTVPPGLRRLPPAAIARRVERARRAAWLAHPDLLQRLRS